MKDIADKHTKDLLSGKRPVGRPPEPGTLTNAQKQKNYRDRLRAAKAAAEAEAASKVLKSDVIDLSATTPRWRR